MKSVHLALAAALASSVAVTALPAMAQVKVDLPVEVNAAQLHVRMASRNQQEIANVRKFLQQSLNCLVGPKGEGFSTAPPAANPCASTGNGVIVDETDPAKKAKYTQIATEMRGLLTGEDRRVVMEAAGKLADQIAETSAQ